MSAPQKIPLKDIESVTNNFADANFIGEGFLGKIYEGQLSLSGELVDVAVRRLDNSFRLQEIAFEKEISTLTRLEHPNVVSIVGYCYENDEMLIIQKRVARGSLCSYLSDPRLTWMRRLQIGVGAVRALSYLHNDVGHNFSVIHHNINCNSILLDENWEAKVSGFEYSMTIPSGNLDLAYEKLGIGTHKSDMFSIGIVLFELMCGKDAFISKDDSSIASLAIFHYENRRLHELVDPDLYGQMNQQSFGIVSETAYSCLIGEGISSNMIQVLKLLQKALEIQQAHENNEHPVVAAERRLSDHMKLKLKSLEHMKIQFEDIVKATENFATKYCIVSGGFGSVYIAELVHVDKAYIFAPDKENEREVPKKRSTVAIKRINNIEDEMSQQGFQAEIEMLTSCKHSNIITLLGFCDEGRALILIYEYASNGSLNYYLQKTRDNENDSWAQRVKICLDIAKGLRYLHTTEGDRDVIVHRDIKSANILLDENFKAKIGDFGLSIFPSVSEQRPTRFSSITLGTPGYMDPQYKKDAKLKKESDVYSFGVVMFEMLCGTVAYDRKYAKNDAGLAIIARQHFNNGKIKEMLDPKIKEQITKSVFTSIKGPSQESLYTFSKIAFECLAKEQVQRPTMEVVVKELEKALFFQPSRVQKLQLQEILYATNHFSDENLLKEGGLGNLYKGRLFQSGKLLDIVARRLNGNYGQGDVEFRTEISMLSSLKHINIISFVGFVDENDEKIVIYELATHGSLDQHISDPTLNWSRRLQICLGVARALSYVHYAIIHCDINSSKIFLDEDWEPKLFGFEFSTKYPQSWRHRLLYSRDSRYSHEIMTPKFDVYCFGTLMFEILCGRKPMIREDVVEEKVDDIIDPNLRKQIDTQSLISFSSIAETCLKKELVERPTMDQIVKELEEAMELQSKHENLSVLEGHSAAAYEDASTKRSKMDILKIPLSEIIQATENFASKYLVGGGGYNRVYRAELDVLDIQHMSSTEGKCKEELPKITKTVAIKHITDKMQGKERFLKEIESLTSCKHPNIVSLLGFSEENDTMVIVYEYVFNRSLGDYFKSTRTSLTWGQRIQISLDIANGINYLHTDMKGKPRMLHHNIMSNNILLDENLNAKVAGFGFSEFHPIEQQADAVYTRNDIVGTDLYIDPEYLATSKYKKEYDVYSFGVVLFEILSGKLAYDKFYNMEKGTGLLPIVRQRFNERTLKELVDPKITEDDEHVLTIKRGPNQDSFDAFSKIAYQCLANSQAKRPTMEIVIKELENALKLQGESIILSRFRLSDIVYATDNFSETYCIGSYAYGMVYKAKLDHFDNNGSLVAVKRISSRENGEGEQRFFSEIELHTTCTHPNIVSLLGFCYEQDEMILLYELASKTRLDDYLKNVDKNKNLTWTQRLHMCLDIACGLNHIHTKMDPRQHGDIRSANVLLGNNRHAKIAYFGISKLHPSNQEAVLQVYWDPEYERTGKLEKESDIYSFGVVMFENFCGRLAYDQVYMDKSEKGLAPIARRCFNDGTIKNMIDPKLMEETDADIFPSNRRPNQDSLDTLLGIAFRCLGETQADRPTLDIVIKEIERALNFQGHKHASIHAHV